MVKIKDILDSREQDMLEHYQREMINFDIEDIDTFTMYQNLISEIIQTAKNRHYAANPVIVPLKKEGIIKDIAKNNTIKVRDLLKQEEAEEVDFLKWKLSISIFPWIRNRNKRKMEMIFAEAKIGMES